MGEFWILILGAFFATNLLDKAESVQLFDEIFGEGWWDKDKAKEWHKLTLEHNFLHQIDRQNTQIGQIEPNSTDQLGQIEPNLTHQSPPLTESDHSGQIEPNSTDQNPLLTESDHSKQIDEIFGEGWWDNDKAKEWNKLTLEQNFLHQIDRQNTQLGQIEPNLTDQLGQIETNSTDQNALLTETDHSGQIELNSTDQNPLLTESDQSDNAKDGEEQNEITSSIAEDKQKHEWLDKGEAEDLKTPAPTNFGQNVHHQIDRQNTQIGQIEPNSTDQNPPLTETDHSGQIEPNSTDQNAPLTESDHFDNAKNNEEQNEVSSNMKTELKRDGFKNSYNHEIDKTVSKELGLNFRTIYKWKRELGQSMTNNSDDKNILTINQCKKDVGLTQRNTENERKHLVEKFDQNKAELMRDGFKNTYKNELDKIVANELGLSFTTIYNWKRELGQTKPNHIYSDSEQLKLMKCYYEIKDQNPKISDQDITKMLKIGIRTLYAWKKQFHPNSVDGHSVEVNAAANVQEIGNTNSESS
uniref:Uncharacterized protein n=1 Tax=Globodera rostochiensis TaxID=31243 RepID=A0A914HQM5_GLORO